jgi:hypothetical protein
VGGKGGVCAEADKSDVFPLFRTQFPSLRESQYLYEIYGLGYGAGFKNATGNNNTCLGDEAGYQNTSGSGNVGIGTSTPVRNLHINDVMRLQPRSAAPDSPAEGDIYMNSTTHKLMVYDGTTWQACW